MASAAPSAYGGASYENGNYGAPSGASAPAGVGMMPVSPGVMHGHGTGAPSYGMAAAPRPTGAPSTQMQYQPPNVSHGVRKLDPRTLPNPSNVPFTRHRVNYNTGTFGNPPPAYSKYNVEDRGSCSPRFMRSTLSQIPCTSSLLNQSNIPMAVVIQPLADTGIEEEEVPIIECATTSGPLRCRRCSAYINPFVKFVENGRYYVCPLCSTQNEIPDEYFSPIEANGFRSDIAERPELYRGSVDFVAPAEYVTRVGNEPPLILFVIDTSTSSLNSGLLRAFINSVKQILETAFSEESGSNMQFGFITFNKSIQFWRLVPKLQLVLVPHLEHVFTPLPASCFIANYATQKNLVDAFFDEVLLSMTSPTATSSGSSSSHPDSCLGPAVNAAMMAIGKSRGGRIVLLQSSLPTTGPGALKSREDVSAYGKDAERAFYLPQNKYYSALSSECSKRFIQVDLFACGSGYSDLATLSELPRTTGGHLLYMPAFSVETHEEKLYYDLYRVMTRTHGSEAIGRLRTSEGLVVESYNGHFNSGDGDVEMAGIDADQTLVVFLKHDGSIEERKDSFVQFAMVHTTEAGQRLIRVHTLAMHSTSVIANVFKSSDLSAVFITLLRRSCATLGKDTPAEIRTEITNRTASILASYRKYCTKSDRGEAQLILPEALKLLPVHVLGALKSLLLSNPTSVTDVPSIADARIFFYHMVQSLPLEALIPIFYPRIYAVHRLHRQLELERLRQENKAAERAAAGQGSDEEEQNEGQEDSNVPLPGDEDHYGSFWQPGLVRASASELEAGGVYLMDDGLSITLAFHPPLDQNISSRLVNEHGQLVFLEEDDLNRRVWNMIQAIRYRRPWYQSVNVIDTQQNTAPRRSFYAHFIEDGSDDYTNKDQIKTLYKLGYSGYLYHVHRSVQDKI